MASPQTESPAASAASVAARPGAVDYSLLALLAGLWGLSFVLIKVGVSEVPPFTLTAVRLMAAAAMMALVLLFQRQRGRITRRGWQLAVISAVFGNAIPFTLIAYGQQVVDAGVASIVLGVMPLTTLLLAHVFVPGERLNWPKTIGVALGFGAIVVLVGPGKLAGLGDEAVSQLLIASAAICYGANAIVTRRMLDNSPPIALACVIMTISTLILWPVAILIEGVPTQMPSPVAGAAILTLGALQTGFGQLLLFIIVARQGASFFSQINFIVPVVGVFWASALLGEQLTAAAIIALVLILSGLAVARAGQRAGGVTSAERRGR